MDRHSHGDGGKREEKAEKEKETRGKIDTGQKNKKKIAWRHADRVLD